MAVMGSCRQCYVSGVSLVTLIQPWYTISMSFDL